MHTYSRGQASMGRNSQGQHSATPLYATMKYNTITFFVHIYIKLPAYINTYDINTSIYQDIRHNIFYNVNRQYLHVHKLRSYINTYDINTNI